MTLGQREADNINLLRTISELSTPVMHNNDSQCQLDHNNQMVT